MYTITFGVQDSYAQEDFYSSERDFDTEKHRVNQKFLNHKILGIIFNCLKFIIKNPDILNFLIKNLFFNK